MEDEQLKDIQRKLDQLIPFFAKASLGDFSKDLPKLDGKDPLAQTYTGIQVMLGVIREKITILEKEVETRKLAQEELMQKDERFQATLDTMSEGFQIIGFDWRYRFVNNAVALQGRRRKKHLLGHTMMEMYPGIEKTEFFAQMKRCMHERVSHQMENEFVFPDGTRNWFELRIEPISEGIFILSLDINKRKKVQAEIAQEKAEDEALLASIGDGMIATDKEGKITLVNNELQTLLGWKRNELIGKPTEEVLIMQDEQGKRIAHSERPSRKAMTTGERVTATYYLLKKDHTRVPVNITATPIFLNKKIIGSVKILHDMTHEKELDHAKDEFIALASHELRTPMTAIKGLTSMILGGDYGQIPEDLKRPLENISISSNRQIRLINDLLNVSRLQTGNIQYSLKNFSIKQVLLEVIESLQPIAQHKEIVFVYNDIEDVLVQGDLDWVKQILNNLLGNALKFTEKDKIFIKTHANKEFEFVMVIDSGVGISPEDQEKLFERFRQVGNVHSTKAVGSGLGLYISRKVARKMGGDVRLSESSVGEGSTFVFSLPKANTPHALKVKEEIQKEEQVASDEKKV